MASDQPCYFLKLPQEIHDMIFKLAYGDKHHGKFTTRVGWKRAEKKNQLQLGPTYEERKFSGHKVDDFMVSKQYFVNAAKAWFGAQHFSSVFGTDGYISGQSLNSGLFRQYGVSLHVYFGFAPRLDHCVALNRITLRIGQNEIQTEDLCPWSQAFTQQDFAAHSKVRDTLSKLPRTRYRITIDVDHEEDTYDKRPEHTAIWESNVKRLGQFMNDAAAAMNHGGTMVEQRASSSKTDTHGTPLYPGSRVCFEHSDMLAPDAAQTLLYDLGVRSKGPNQKSYPPTTADDLMQRWNTTPQELWERYEAGRVLLL